MTPPLPRGMARVTDLTRSGKLHEATALIRSLLQPPPAAPETPAGPDTPAGDDITEGTFHRLDDTAHPAPPRASPAPARRPRKRLAETLRDLAARGMPQPTGLMQNGGMPAASPDLPDGAQFLSLSHSGAEGSRTYRLYIPANQSATRAGDRMPLIVMLHGCTQSPEDFAIGTGMNALAEESGCLIAWPAQPQAANMQKCWNWFRPGDQGRDRGEPAVIAGMVRDILRDHGADPARVYVAGLSAGGAAAAIMGAAYPDIFAAVGVHSGLPVGGAQDVPSAFAAMRNGSAGRALARSVPTIVFQGLADTTVHPANAEAVIAQVLRTRPGLTRVSGTGPSDRASVGASAGGRSYRHIRHTDTTGRSIAEHWEIAGTGHAWSGGQAGGSYTDPNGPDASREMLRFFLQHRRA